MRRIFVVAAAAVLAFPAVVQAQSSASANLTVSADVIKALTFSATTATLPFNQRAASTTATISPSAGATFTADGQASQAVTVTFSGGSLTGTGPALTFTPNVEGSSNGTSGWGAVTHNGSINLSGAGTYFFRVGGSITIPSNQTAGTYSGTWTLQIAYTGL
jgi:hypothetical protein